MPYINTEADFRLLAESSDFLVTEDFDPSEIAIMGGGYPPKAIERKYKKDRLRDLLYEIIDGPPKAGPVKTAPVAKLAKQAEKIIAARPVTVIDVTKIQAILDEAERVNARIVQAHMRSALVKAEQDDVISIMKMLAENGR
jgi:hypothetical protein